MRRDPNVAVDALVAANKDLDRDTQLAMVRKTLPVVFPAAGKPFGWMDPVAWNRYGDWMYDNKLLGRAPNAARALTDEFLPGQGLADAGDAG
jgi:putative hydroxymethylpyrimidine transport system substrate-binding protein